MTAAAEQRRSAREKRREVTAGGRQTSEERPGRGNARNEIAAVGDFVGDRVRQTSPSTAVVIGAALIAVAGVVAATGRKKPNDGNTISGDIAVHLLNRVELLTIRLQVHHARRGVPATIDVHRVEADASSRASDD